MVSQQKLIKMDDQNNQLEHQAASTVENTLKEIARATVSPPASLPKQQPENIPATTADTNGSASLLLGIISICIPIIFLPVAIVGLVLGLLAQKPFGKMAKTGIILNVIALAICLLGSVGIFLYILLR